MADELMSAIDYTPTTDVVRQAVTFPRLRLGEPRHMTSEAFDRWLAAYEAEVRERIAQEIAREIEALMWPGDPWERYEALRDALAVVNRIVRGATR